MKRALQILLGTNPHGMFVAHGLTPIWDSTLLIADLGRASRAARAFDVPLNAMVADVTWMSYNRSLRRFDFSDSQMESGTATMSGSSKTIV